MAGRTTSEHDGGSAAMALAEALGIRSLHDAEDEVVCELVIAAEHLNLGLIAHGGALFTLAATALGLLVNRRDAGPTWVATSFSMQLFGGAAVGDRIRATARTEHAGRRLRACRIELRRDGGPVGVLLSQLVQLDGGHGSRTPDSVPWSARPARAGDPLERALEAARTREGREGDPPPGAPRLVLERAGAPVGYAVLEDDGSPWDLWLPAHLRDPVADAAARAAIGAASAAAGPSPQRPVLGGCLCGAVRYAVSAPFRRANICHCSRCRRHSGAAHGVQGRVARSGFSLLQGAEAVRTYVPDGGMAKAFCTHCGSSLFGGTWPDGEEVSIRLGTLDSDPGISPQFHTFCDDAPVWDHTPPDGLPRHPAGAVSRR